MANDEHVALLKKGVDAWNEWREKNPDIHPDLSGANLRKANLRKANLSEADLGGANLSGANLWRADLTMANLSGANLMFATLVRMDLTDADHLWRIRVESRTGEDRAAELGHHTCGRTRDHRRQHRGRAVHLPHAQQPENVHRYASQEQLIADLGEKVIRPAELKVLDLQGST
jgi:hypothetical protein